MTVSMSEPTGEPRAARPILWVSLVLVGVFAFAGLIALGLWQLERLEWKKALIARVEQRLAQAPVPAPGPSEWADVEGERGEYRRVLLRGRYAHERETLVSATTALGSGYWVLTPLRVEPGFWVLVNRGFILPAQRERATRGPDGGDEEQTVVGLLRTSEPGGRLLQDNAPDVNRWYSRDVAAIAAARGLGGDPVAPYFVDATAADDAPLEWPRPGLTVLHFNNNHLGYALTWFLLAGMVALALGYVVVSEIHAQSRRHAHDD